MIQHRDNIPESSRADGLLIYCSDFRYWKNAFNFMLEDMKIAKFDVLCYPGSAYNLCHDLRLSQEFLEKISFLLNRHGFHTIVIANHTDCGAYGDRSSFHSEDTEKQTHLMDLMTAKSKLISEFPHVKIIPIFIYQKHESIHVERVM